MGSTLNILFAVGITMFSLYTKLFVCLLPFLDQSQGLSSTDKYCGAAACNIASASAYLCSFKETNLGSGTWTLDSSVTDGCVEASTGTAGHCVGSGASLRCLKGVKTATGSGDTPQTASASDCGHTSCTARNSVGLAASDKYWPCCVQYRQCQ